MLKLDAWRLFVCLAKQVLSRGRAGKDSLGEVIDAR
jgi:hypothetical protein